MAVEPRCEYFGSCGGCSLQHVPYKDQVEQKKNQVLWQLMINGCSIPKHVNIVSAEPFGYRNRMDFVLSTDGPGLRKKERFYDIVPIRACPISNKKLNELLNEVWQFFEKDRDAFDVFISKEKKGTFRYAVIRTPELSGDSSITFIANRASERLAEQEALLNKFVTGTSAKNVLLGSVDPRQDVSIDPKCRVLKGSVFLEEHLCGKRLSFHSQGFFQNNSRIAEKMLNVCRDIFKKYPAQDKTLVDLYGGAGTFGIVLSDLFKQVLVIDSDGGNIARAQENIALNQLNNISARCADAKLVSDVPSEDLYLLVDPPRAGLNPKVLRKVMDLQAKVLVYVSCNPAQLARELAVLQQDYTVQSLTVFDHFPQTPHIETIVDMVLR